ncbi:class II fructose-bisphosphate aldolase family protein [Clostridium sediminicola]|uniref:class II fructose-bisphosphate aldolase n=1 Tax=Clostridium sediminicola TaxID=3114879 RepID=UPI0031F222AF
MLINEKKLLMDAQKGKYAVGAFNVYNMEGVKAVISSAQKEKSPIILQLHPIVLEYGGAPFIEMCKKASETTEVPVAIHFDHSDKANDIELALNLGVKSVMADGSQLEYRDNLKFTKKMADLAHKYEAVIEGEYGRLSGSEDGITVAEHDAKLTNPLKAKEYVEYTSVDSLAVCIGNVHGHYKCEPVIDFERLTEISKSVEVPLVLHGGSGLKEDVIKKCIELGICKVNVNTEVREAYLNAMKKMSISEEKNDLLKIMNNCIEAMGDIVVSKIKLFGSYDRY